MREERDRLVNRIGVVARRRRSVAEHAAHHEIGERRHQERQPAGRAAHDALAAARDVHRDHVAAEAERVLAASQHREREENERDTGIAKPTILTPARLRDQPERAEHERHERLAVRDPGERQRMTWREGEDGGREERDAIGQETPEERARGQDRRHPPRERVEMHRQRRMREEPVIDPQERARERPEEPDRQVRLGPPRQKPTRGEDGAVGVVDEGVEVERAPGDRKGPLDHRALEVIVQKKRRKERRGEQRSAAEEHQNERETGPSRYLSRLRTGHGSNVGIVFPRKNRGRRKGWITVGHGESCGKPISIRFFSAWA